jgi:hypothetical protein
MAETNGKTNVRRLLFNNLQLPLSHIQQSQFQQEIAQEIIQQFSHSWIVLFELPGDIGTPEQRVWAIK